MDALLHKLYARRQQGGIKAGLDNMLTLASLLKHPERKFDTIHIAGSNGKGSVATKIAQGLQLAGLRVGLFTSPHITSFRERIQINGDLIPEVDLLQLLTALFELIEKHGIKATFFEMTTILAFHYFARANVDVAVIETGLGGRLDPTNIIIPCLSVITSISLEHCAILGDSLDAIAVEKGGIIKPQVPIVIGPKVPRQPIFAIADRQKSICHTVDGTFDTFDAENSAVASRALEILGISADIRAQAVAMRPPCRCEILSGLGPPAVILDVAHNPDGFRYLLMGLRKEYPKQKLRVICGMSQDKDIPAALAVLQAHATYFHFVQAKMERSCPKEQLCDTLLALGTPAENIFLAASTVESVRNALDLATVGGDILVVCGSFFIMAEIRSLLSR